jgi:hypothetical protein
MFLVREVMHCKPGQVRPLVDKFKTLESIMKRKGFDAPLRILTDVSGERYWTMIAEQEVESLEKYAEMSRQTMSDPELQKAMQGYHDLVQEGHREIYQIER